MRIPTPLSHLLVWSGMYEWGMEECPGWMKDQLAAVRKYNDRLQRLGAGNIVTFIPAVVDVPQQCAYCNAPTQLVINAAGNKDRMCFRCWEDAIRDMEDMLVEHVADFALREVKRSAYIIPQTDRAKDFFVKTWGGDRESAYKLTGKERRIELPSFVEQIRGAGLSIGKLSY